MRKFFICLCVSLLLAINVGLSADMIAFARGQELPAASTAYDLVNAVNALRASQGISTYKVNSILMNVAQAQANYMASIGTWSDYGPGGSTLAQRLIAAGYPLAGDLSAGGLASQNVLQGTSGMTPQAAINAWTGDAGHRIALFSTSLTEIGAGVTYAGGDVYYVIDCAQPTGSGQQQAYTPSANGTSVSQSQMIPVAIVSTPDQAGNVYHIVRPGQALWEIAIAYKVKINDIMNLNGLTSNVIFPNQKLLIMRLGTPTPVPPTVQPTMDLSTFTPLPTLGVATDAPTGSPTPIPDAPAKSQNGTMVVGGIILAALIAAGFIAWSVRQRPV